jgi:hypothetical protein
MTCFFSKKNYQAEFDLFLQFFLAREHKDFRAWYNEILL